jgi:glyoxylase-like metal-dependent hydrolase (beta-lactamase superfamily II)
VDEPWREVGDRVFVRRHREMDVNAGLVVGDGLCLVVDTRCSQAEGRDLVEAVGRVTPTPWLVAITHAHFDHCFGTSAFTPAQVWAHERCATVIANGGAANRSRMAGLYDEDGQPDVAQQIRDTPVVVPELLVQREQALDVGGRHVELRHLGRGHTDHDLVVVVPDADVVFAGDLVEEGAPPQFRDAYPLDWPSTLDALLAATTAAVVVPGHGDVVDRGFVTAQQDVLAALVRASRKGLREGVPVGDVAAQLRELGSFAVQGVERTYRQLTDEPARRA